MKQSANRSIPSYAALLPSLHSLQQSLARAQSPQCRRRAALAVFRAYSNYYGKLPGAREHMEQLQQAATSIRCLPLLSKRERERLIVFCEFTLLLAEAANAMSGLSSQINKMKEAGTGEHV